MRDALTLAITVESGNGEIATAAAQCGVEASEVASIMIEALAWSQQIAEVNRK
jgi:hypothetical protein